MFVVQTTFTITTQRLRDNNSARKTSHWPWVIVSIRSSEFGVRSLIPLSYVTWFRSTSRDVGNTGPSPPPFALCAMYLAVVRAGGNRSDGVTTARHDNYVAGECFGLGNNATRYFSSPNSWRHWTDTRHPFPLGTRTMIIRPWSSAKRLLRPTDVHSLFAKTNCVFVSLVFRYHRFWPRLRSRTPYS